ncbi:MAG: SDR family oxidoreductase [Saprospirales bacterium]|nr:SDR family oxidoreductase [Saprospirales bacterium]MBK8492053.1 SDR family oxidoreductase [Saprospirales bacterium]
MDFNDQLIWITGASSGIGEGLAKAFSRRGARLILTARRMEELARVRAACADPEKVWIYPLDMADHDRMPALVRQVTEKLGPVDILVNNAGMTSRGLAVETKLEVDKRMMDVNYFGPVALTKALLPQLLERKKGLIIVMSSVIGKFGTALRSSYAPPKHALHGFFDSLRGEVWADGIRVVLVIPGYVGTQITMKGLKGDGSTMNEKGDGQHKAMSPEDFSEQLIRALDSSKEDILIGGFREMAAVYLKRFFPRVLSSILKKAKLT